MSVELREWSGRLSVLALVCAVAGTLTTATPGRADEHPWEVGKQWLSLRAGYAGSTAKGSGNGGFGYGFGYSRQLPPWKVWNWTLFKYFSLGGYVHHEMVSRFGSATEIDVPVTVELVRHFRWTNEFRPYLGAGGGAFYRRTNRTGEDMSRTKPGFYVTVGGNTPIHDRHLLGIDARVVFLNARNDPLNPVFGAGDKKAKHWSVKLNYALAY